MQARSMQINKKGGKKEKKKKHPRSTDDRVSTMHAHKVNGRRDVDRSL